MPADRLKELVRQRALLAEHLAWLDREIAAAEGNQVPSPGADPSPAAAMPPAAIGSHVLSHLTDPDAEALFDRLRTEEQGKGQISKQGCWIVFAILMLVGVVGVATLVFVRYR